ncbi:FAD dependent oxidoreductase [Mycena floridula]|nr:FAD dependent oxidoreductase [Mycena floridula]
MRGLFTSLSFSLAVTVVSVASFSSDAKISPCAIIQKAISSRSAVFYPGDPTYVSDNSHWASSSVQNSTCSVEPGTAADVGLILNILGATKTKFAVKGGGHTTNQGYSSTTGVQISMARFNQVVYDNATKTATVGAGLLWDQVYETLIPLGVNVVGGRVPGVGVAGFTLGGGYSFKTNQYGLTVDTIVAYELVKPNGKVVTVTLKSDPELFFGLKGGFNNFGIVTRFTLKTHTQGQVWGGSVLFSEDQTEAITEATAKFSATNTDPNAALILNYISFNGQRILGLEAFYDGPEPPAGLFDDFIALPPILGTLQTSDFITLFKSSPPGTPSLRASFTTPPAQAYTPQTLAVIFNESTYWSNQFVDLNTTFFLSYNVEPFLPSAYTQNTSPSAFPPSSSRAKGFLPTNLFFGWSDAAFDSIFLDAIKQSTATILNSAVAEGQLEVASAPLYPNYAQADTSLQQMYAENVPALKALKKRVDPSGIMNLAGGVKFI